jgi:hypothetical protein
MAEKRPLCLYSGVVKELQGSDHAHSVVPGSILLLPSDVSATDYLPCDGSHVSTTTYPALASLPADAEPGVVWENHGAVTSLVSVCLGGNGSIMIAAGGSGTYYTSTDKGKTWTVRNVGYNSTINSIAWNGTVFVMVLTGPACYTSPDGVTWTSRTFGGTSPPRYVFWVSSLSQFVAIGDSGLIKTSPDGITWTNRTTGTANYASGAWNGSLLVIVGSGGAVYTSPDGVTWTSRTSGTTNGLNSVCHDGSNFYAVGVSGTIIKSADGITWSTVAFDDRHGPNYILWTGTHLVMGGGNSAIYTSTNGTTWTKRNYDTPAGTSFYGGMILYDKIWFSLLGGYLIASPIPVSGKKHIPYMEPQTGPTRYFMRVT